MVLLSRHEKIERFVFSKVEPGSPVASLLGLSPEILARVNWWVCNGPSCPVCGKETIYVKATPGVVDLDAPDALPMRDLFTAMAQNSAYGCPDCAIEWTNVAAYRASIAYQNQMITLRRLRAIPSYPVIH